MSELGKGLAGELTASGHLLRQRVYFEDTDFTGIVYHARYLHFLERGRTDFLRLVGIHHAEIDGGLHGEKLAWVVRRMTIDFVSPARIDEILAISTRVEEISGARIVMAQQVHCGERLLIEARVEAAIVNGEGRPRRLPKDWIARFPSAVQTKITHP
jgi:acyl-CoA thioester hydrolase